MTTIDQRQNSPANLRVLAAARQRYADRKRAHRWRLLGTVLIAAASPIVVVFSPSSGPWLGALSGLWIFVSRTLLAAIEDRSVEDARHIQEGFDCQVLALPRNNAIGSGPTLEKVVAAADRFKEPDGLRDWYPAKDLTDGPRDALICQRSSVAWGQRLHTEYMWIIGSIAVLVGSAGVAVGIVRGLKLADYLVAIFLPSLPALLDTIDLVRAHLQASRIKGVIEAEMTALLSSPAVAVDGSACRAFQDRIFAQRGRDPVVADLYYRLRRGAYERHMIEVANEIANWPTTT